MKFIWVGFYCGFLVIVCFSSYVVVELCVLGYDVVIYCIEIGDVVFNVLLFDLVVFVLGSVMEEEWLWMVDLVFVNIGDYYGFYGGIFELVCKCLFVGVMYDWFVLNLFWDCLKVEGWLQDVLCVIQGFYGQEVGELCVVVISEIIMIVVVEYFLMMQWVVFDLFGCIIYFEFYCVKVQVCCLGLVYKLLFVYFVLNVLQDC